MRLIRRVYRLALLVTFLAVGSFGIFVLLDGNSDRCETRICCIDCQSAVVARIIDGDTLVVDRRFQQDQRVRLYGVDTPEVGEPCSDEATDLLRQLAGGRVRVETGPRAEDVYERSLYYLYTQSGDSIDEILVREGLGIAWTRDGQHRDLLVDLERQAKSSGTGCLW
ncbi:MAG: thermonuclease family protein [Chloroflexi bacterium]|nr:thermonuclease family protein [Chloroflexota bacterium]MDA1227200.1 thermonuclease family protein [Chloroflexota bacterium]